MTSYTSQQTNYLPRGSTKERYGVEMMADIIVPAQYGFSMVELVRGRNGPHLLLAAVLEQAVKEFQDYACLAGVRAERLHQEAADWLFSDADDWPFRAVVVCQHLGVNLDRLRASLRQWLAVKQAGQPVRPAVVEIVAAPEPSPYGGRPKVLEERYSFAKRCVPATRLYHAYVTDNETGTTYHVGMYPFATVKRMQERLEHNRDMYGPRYIAGITAPVPKAARNTTAPTEGG